MQMSNQIEYSNNNSKTSRHLYLFYRDKPALDDNGVPVNFQDNNGTKFLKLKEKVSGRTGNNDTKNEKYLQEKFTVIFNSSITDCMSKVNNTQRHCCSNANVLSNRVQ